jgi:TonB family protein
VNALNPFVRDLLCDLPASVPTVTEQDVCPDAAEFEPPPPPSSPADPVEVRVVDDAYVDVDLDSDDVRAADELDEVAFAPVAAGLPHPPASAPTPTLAQRIARPRVATPLSAILALSVHTAAIAAGFYFFVLHAPQPPAIELPYGWAVEREGQGRTGAAAAPANDAPTFAEPSAPPTIFAPPVLDDVRPPQASQALGPPPGELPPPDVTAPLPPSPLDDRHGTTAETPVIALAADHAAPAFSPRTPPGFTASSAVAGSAGAPDAATDPTPAANAGPVDEPAPAPPSTATPAAAALPPPRPDPTADVARAGSGAARTGTGSEDGGGVRGSQTDHLDLRSIPVRIPRDAKPDWIGTTVVSFYVDDRGRVRDVRMLAPSGYPLYDEEVLDALKNRWRPTREFWGSFYNNQRFNFDPRKAG